MEETNSTDVLPTSGVESLCDRGAFWRVRTLAELAAEQGVPLVPDFGALVGQGKESWADDAECDSFLRELRESRREGA
jgi:hypothetical protein